MGSIDEASCRQNDVHDRLCIPDQAQQITRLGGQHAAYTWRYGLVGGHGDRYRDVSCLGRDYGASCPGYPTLVNHGESGSGSTEEGALAMASECYALGEITKEEFDQIKKDLS